MQDKHWLVFLAGGVAGIFSWVTTYPQVKIFLQIDKSTIFEIFIVIFGGSWSWKMVKAAVIMVMIRNI